MNNILQKCLDELSKESPKLDYVRGMLETLIEMQTPINIKKTFAETVGPANPIITTGLPPMPNLEKIKAIAAESMQ
jgi:hypothetical protein